MSATEKRERTPFVVWWFTAESLYMNHEPEGKGGPYTRRGDRARGLANRQNRNRSCHLLTIRRGVSRLAAEGLFNDVISSRFE